MSKFPFDSCTIAIHLRLPKLKDRWGAHHFNDFACAVAECVCERRAACVCHSMYEVKLDERLHATSESIRPRPDGRGIFEVKVRGDLVVQSAHLGS